MKYTFDDFLKWLDSASQDRVRRMHNFLWSQYHSISLKSNEEISLVREILWKIRHTQARLKELQ